MACGAGKDTLRKTGGEKKGKIKLSEGKLKPQKTRLHGWNAELLPISVERFAQEITASCSFET